MKTIYVDTPEELATTVCRIIVDHNYSWLPTKEAYPTMSEDLTKRFNQAWSQLPRKVQNSFDLGQHNPYTTWDGVIGHVYLVSKLKSAEPILVCLKGSL